ncbi:MAG: hypothetical protein QM683_07215 [Lacrimispora sp.]
MKKFIKTCLIAGSVCVLLGGAMAVAAAIMGGTLTNVIPSGILKWKEEFPGVSLDGAWDGFDHYYDQMRVDADERGQEIFSSADVKQMDIEARAGKVLIEEDPSADRVRVFCNGDKTQFSVQGDGEELELKTYPGNGDESQLLFTVLVPKDYRFESVDLTLSHPNRIRGREVTSPVIMVNSLSSDEMDLETKVGAIKVIDGRAEELSILCSVGAVDFSGTATGDINAECRVGAIKMELDGKKEDYNYNTRCSLGAVRIGSESIAGLKDEKRVDNEADKTMDLECKTGAIEVDFINDL